MAAPVAVVEQVVAARVAVAVAEVRVVEPAVVVVHRVVRVAVVVVARVAKVVARRVVAGMDAAVVTVDVAASSRSASRAIS